MPQTGRKLENQQQSGDGGEIMSGTFSNVCIQSVGAKKYLGKAFLVNIRPVTIITGFTELTALAIHPLLLLKQSVETPDLPPGFLRLDGPYVYSDARESFSIEISLGTAKYGCTYDIYEMGKYALATSSYLRAGNTETVVYRNTPDKHPNSLVSPVEYGPFLYWKTASGVDNGTSVLESILHQIKTMIYVPARERMHLKIQEVREPLDFSGPFNEYAYNLLYTWREQDENRAREVEKCLSEILSTSIDLCEDWRRHGGGFHALLPIVVAAVVSEPRQIVCVEYPEMNLHPVAQKGLLSFLVQTAQKGTVFILTTHSESILSCAKNDVPEDLLSVFDGTTNQQVS